MTSDPTPGLPPLNYAAPARDDLRQIATRQRAIMLCILGYIILVVVYALLPMPLKGIGALAVIAVSITAAVFIFMLSLALYSTAVGIILGILTLIPLVNLIILLIINGKATQILRAHGIKVGLMGANMSQLPSAPIR